ncbi:MAG: alpha/beta fold hydrolase [Gemmatimonadota bacterium]|nr:alpha/beta fold hydrolase [Gemmatimonadota bacterium]
MRTLLICTTIALAPLGTPSQAYGQESEQGTTDPSEFVGNWVGSLSVGTVQLRMRFEIGESGGELTANVFSVDQGNAQVPVESVTLTGATVAIAMPIAGATFEGTLSADGNSIEGSFAQMGSTLALNLERTDAEETETRRPQDPVEPFPYLSEDVSYANPDGGHTLAGTFTRPESGGPFPTVILISGSGPQDRDEALLGHRPFLVLSDHLTRRGIAVLRFDDRGFGESTGNFATATSRDFASDVLAGVAYLKTRDDVDADAIGLAGHSEGGLIAPMVAAGSDDVAYIVLMAGPGVNGEQILYAQGELIARANGASRQAIAQNRELQRAMFAVLKAEPDVERAGAVLAELVRAALEEAGEEVRAQAGITDDATLDGAVAAQVQSVNTPWFRYFLTYEPAETIERVTVPVLAINGERDLQVPYEENLREIEAALRRGGNTEYEIHALPGLNHLFQYSDTGSPSEYQAIEETWAVEVMELIADWILETVEG